MGYHDEETISCKIAKILSENEVKVDEIDQIFDWVESYLYVHLKEGVKADSEKE